MLGDDIQDVLCSHGVHGGDEQGAEVQNLQNRCILVRGAGELAST